jgi:hypothetical protein
VRLEALPRRLPAGRGIAERRGDDRYFILEQLDEPAIASARLPASTVASPSSSSLSAVGFA